MMSHLKITILFLFAVSFLAARESGAEKDYVYPFKNRIHSMCAGHHHLQPDEFKTICNQFSEHFDDILELQATPPEFRPDWYIQALTAMVSNSDTLTEEQKQLFYKRSYEQVLQARKKGEEWGATLFALVRTKGALSRSELEQVAKTTTDKPLKKYIEETVLKKNRKRQGSIDINDKFGNSSTSRESSKPATTIAASQAPLWSKWPIMLAVILVFGAVLVWLKAKSRK